MNSGGPEANRARAGAALLEPRRRRAGGEGVRDPASLMAEAARDPSAALALQRMVGNERVGAIFGALDDWVGPPTPSGPVAPGTAPSLPAVPGGGAPEMADGGLGANAGELAPADAGPGEAPAGGLEVPDTEPAVPPGEPGGSADAGAGPPSAAAAAPAATAPAAIAAAATAAAATAPGSEPGSAAASMTRPGGSALPGDLPGPSAGDAGGAPAAAETAGGTAPRSPAGASAGAEGPGPGPAAAGALAATAGKVGAPDTSEAAHVAAAAAESASVEAGTRGAGGESTSTRAGSSAVTSGAGAEQAGAAGHAAGAGAEQAGTAGHAAGAGAEKAGTAGHAAGAGAAGQAARAAGGARGGAAHGAPAEHAAAGGHGAGAARAGSGAHVVEDPAVPGSHGPGGGGSASIDEELAEHQRWAQAGAAVGAAESPERAAFLADMAGRGLITGLGEGFTGALKMGIGIQMAEHMVPIPGVGLVIGGYFALTGIIDNWSNTVSSIGNIGQGADFYEQAANTLAGIATIIDLIVNILNVIGGIAGAIAIAMWIITVLTVGVATPLAATITAIAGAVLLAAGIVNGILQATIQPVVAMFRALHAFKSQADPRSVMAQGAQVQGATGIMGGQIGGLAGMAVMMAGQEEGHGQTPAEPEPLSGPRGEAPAIEFQPPAEGGGVAPAEAGVAPAAGAGPGEGALPGRTTAPLEGAVPGEGAVPADSGTPRENVPGYGEIALEPGTGPTPELDTGPRAAGDLPAHGEVNLEPGTGPVPELETGPVAAGDVPAYGEVALEPGTGPTPELDMRAGGTGEQPHPATPDIEIRGSDAAVRNMQVFEGENTGAPRLNDVAKHMHQGTGREAAGLISEHVTPANEMAAASRDPQYGGEPDIQGRIGGNDTPDVNNQLTVNENKAVSDRKTELDNQARLARGDAPLDPFEARDAALQRHQQAVDDAVAAGEITPEQATDPVIRAQVADAQLWGAGERGGGMAKARADAEAAGARIPQPRLPERVRAAEDARRAARIQEGGEAAPDFTDAELDSAFSPWEGNAPPARSPEINPSLTPPLELDPAATGSGQAPTTGDVSLPPAEGPISELDTTGLDRSAATTAAEPTTAPAVGPQPATGTPQGAGTFESPLRGAQVEPDRLGSLGDQGSGQGSSHGVRSAGIPGVEGPTVIKQYPDTPSFREKIEGEMAVGQIAQEAGVGVPIHGVVDVPPTPGGSKPIGFAMGRAEGGFFDLERGGASPQAAHEAARNGLAINDQSFADVRAFRDALTARGYEALGDTQGFVGPDGRWRPIDFQSYREAPGVPPEELAARNAAAFEEYMGDMRNAREAARSGDFAGHDVSDLLGQSSGGPGSGGAPPPPPPPPAGPAPLPPPLPTAVTPTPVPRAGVPVALPGAGVGVRIAGGGTSLGGAPMIVAGPAGPAGTRPRLAGTSAAAGSGTAPVPEYGNTVGGIMAGALDQGARGGVSGATKGAAIGNALLPGIGAGIGAQIGGAVGAGYGAVTGAMDAASRPPGISIDPSTGAGAELVNPRYQNPPGTPQQIAAIRRQIADLERERAQTQRARSVADGQARQAGELTKGADQARDATMKGSQRAGETHQEASQREGVNQQAQAQQGEAHGQVASYPERAAGLAVLITPLHGFRSFLHYAEMLPGDVGAKFHQMDQEAAGFQRALVQVGGQMAQTAAQGPVALAGWQQEQQQIVGARAQAQGAQQTFAQQTQQAEQISQKATEAQAQRSGASARASRHESQVTGQIEQRDARASSLASQLAAWATEHRAARLRAIEETRQRYTARGYRVTVRGA